MVNTFLSTWKSSEIAYLFVANNRKEQIVDYESKNGEISIGCTFSMENINRQCFAMDLSGTSVRLYKEKVWVCCHTKHF